ncbi:hypothetical protein YC2023_014260 [Brassica napus]
MMSRCDAEEDPSQTKKRKQSPSSGLPEEMVLSCLARVSRSEHASLSLVSKRHRSLWTTPELYKFRTLLGCTENLIHLCLRIPPDPNPGWFTLSLKPLDRRLVPVRSYFYQPLDAAPMGGRIGGRASSTASGVVDGEIYILGGCDDRNSSRWGEVFDPKKQTWDPLPIQCALGGRILWCEAHEWERPVATHVMEWREVMGLESLWETLAASKLVNYGGRLGDLWESNKPLMLAAGF